MESPNVDERRRFERIYLYRALYARRGPRDSVGVISLGEMIRSAEALLTRATRPAHSAPAAS